MGPVTLCLGLHHHQPVGNFDHVFAEAAARCYRPILETLREYPEVLVSLHYSGPLLDWFVAHQPDFFELLAPLLERGQVEIIGGGYYEPILPALPERDVVGQLEMMNGFLKRKFGHAPRGFWLAERVWEPDIPQIVAQAGLEYTFVDDTHFRLAGIKPEDLRGYYVTDKAGAVLKIFPIDRRLRYAIPFREAQEVVDELCQRAGGGGQPIFTYADDAEKFGLWPETYNWVFERGWLKRFLETLSRQKDRIVTRHFSEVVDHEPPHGRIYLPSAAYDEMMEWALPAESGRDFRRLEDWLRQVDPEHGELVRRFLHGSIWPAFWTKYPEANRLRTRMLLTSERVEQARKKLGANHPAVQNAQLHLYRGQCNCAYWHGLFGGLMLNYLRAAVFHNLLAAEDLLQKAGLAVPAVQIRDVDCDSREEVILDAGYQAAIIAPWDGGVVTELDLRAHRFHFTDVLTRRPEAYHDRVKGAVAPGEEANQPSSIHDRVLAKEKDLEQKLFYDHYPRHAFRLAFCRELPTVEALWHNGLHDDADWLRTGYGISGHDPARCWVRLSCCTPSGDQLEREYQFSGEGREFSLALTVQAGSPRQGFLALESNFTLLTPRAADRRLIISKSPAQAEAPGSHGAASGVEWFRLADEWLNLDACLAVSIPGTLAWYPLEVVSQSEAGFERVYQGTAFVWLWPINLATGQKITLVSKLTAGHVR